MVWARGERDEWLGDPYRWRTFLPFPGDTDWTETIEDFRQRVMARLVLLPPHDPQFRRNRERVARDAERENLILEWDLGLPEDDRDTAVAKRAAWDRRLPDVPTRLVRETTTWTVEDETR